MPRMARSIGYGMRSDQVFEVVLASISSFVALPCLASLHHTAWYCFLGRRRVLSWVERGGWWTGVTSVDLTCRYDLPSIMLSPPHPPPRSATGGARQPLRRASGDIVDAVLYRTAAEWESSSIKAPQRGWRGRPYTVPIRPLFIHITHRYPY